MNVFPIIPGLMEASSSSIGLFSFCNRLHGLGLGKMDSPRWLKIMPPCQRWFSGSNKRRRNPWMTRRKPLIRGALISSLGVLGWASMPGIHPSIVVINHHYLFPFQKAFLLWIFGYLFLFPRGFIPLTGLFLSGKYSRKGSGYVTTRDDRPLISRSPQ